MSRALIVTFVPSIFAPPRIWTCVSEFTIVRESLMLSVPSAAGAFWNAFDRTVAVFSASSSMLPVERSSANDPSVVRTLFVSDASASAPPTAIAPPTAPVASLVTVFEVALRSFTDPPSRSAPVPTDAIVSVVALAPLCTNPAAATPIACPFASAVARVRRCRLHEHLARPSQSA